MLDRKTLVRRMRKRLRRWPSPWRVGVQLFFLGIVLWIGRDFARFVRFFETGGQSPWSPRPGGVEAFLPISALMSLKYWLATGLVHPVHPAGLVLFVTIVGTSVLLKKAFCSWVCPVGMLSEWLGRIGRKLVRFELRVPRWLDIPLRGIKYLLLGFFLWVILTMPAPAIGAFLDSPYNRVADVKMLKFFTEMGAATAWTLLVLAGLSLVIRNLWCRYLCPYGALLGLGSLLSPWKVTRNPDACTDCGLCAKACPSALPVDRLARIRSDECTGCLECVRSCPVRGALHFELPGAVPAPPLVRRISPAGAAAFVLAVVLLPIGAARIAGMWHGSVSNAEYGRRIVDLNDPIYTHAYGQAPPDSMGR